MLIFGFPQNREEYEGKRCQIDGETWTGSLHRAKFGSLWVVYVHTAYRECKLRERVGRRVGGEGRADESGVVLLMISRRG